MLDDKRFAKEKARIGKFMTKWQGPMGLRWFRIEIVWDRSYAKNGQAAETDMSRWKYREATITFFIPSLMNETDHALERVVVHELCHVLLGGISCFMVGTDDDNDYRREFMELNTDLVADAFMWAREAGADDHKAELKAKAKSATLKSDKGVKTNERRSNTRPTPQPGDIAAGKSEELQRGNEAPSGAGTRPSPAAS